MRSTAVRALPFACLLLFFCASTAEGLAALPQADLPSPEAVLGRKPGSDFFLATYDESLAYMRRLAQASDRVQLAQVGQTSGGLDWYMAFISSPQNLSRLEHYKDLSRRLAAAKGLSDEEARRLAAEGRAIVHIDGGLHATEVAHAQHTIQLAYDLASSQDPQVRFILDEVILALWFCINPDGQNMVANWYRRNLGTPYEVSPLPWLYQKYVGHDNNRDGYMNNMLESQVVTRATLEISPQVFYNHHQTAPFPARIWIPPFAEPVSSNVHPLMWRWVNLFGTGMAAYLDERGMPGSIHRGRGFDDWYPGFIDHVNSFRNTISFLTETALYRYATPHFYTLGDFPRDRRDLRSEVFYSSPWKGGWWRLGDAVRYMLGASMSVLDTAAKYRENLLYNRYQAGRDVIQRFSDEPPYAYLVPPDQRDPATAALLVEKVRLNGVEVFRSRSSFEANNRQFPAGTWVIPMDQAFAALVKELFEVQDYPDLRDFPDGPPDLPYDVAGWTLPLQMGVEATPLSSPISDSLRGSLERLDAVAPPPGRLEGSGAIFRVDAGPNALARVVNAALTAGGRVSFHPPAGPDSSGQVQISGLARADLQQWVEQHGLRAQASSDSGEGPEAKAPRVGLFRPWRASMDEGWTRWLLEDYGFNPISLYNADVISGRLNDRYDVILIADISSRDILEGYEPGTLPGEFAGGIGDSGVQNLIQFVENGGTLITFNDASEFAIERFNIPLENVLEGLSNQEFFCSGSILSVEIEDPSHPVALGMPKSPNLMFQRGPAFKPKAGFKGRILAKYPKERNPLMSGYLLGPEKIQGAAALAEAYHGKGRIILFGFRPQWRGQSHGAYKLVFNSLYYFEGMARQAAPPQETARSHDLEIWEELRRSIHQDMRSLIQGNQAFHEARGTKALQAGRELESKIESFQKTLLSALGELASAAEAEQRRKIDLYNSRLKNVLVDLRSRDLTGVGITLDDLAVHYGLSDLEKEIAASLGAH